MGSIMEVMLLLFILSIFQLNCGLEKGTVRCHGNLTTLYSSMCLVK